MSKDSMFHTLNVPKLSSRSAYMDQTFRDLYTLFCTVSVWKVRIITRYSKKANYKVLVAIKLIIKVWVLVRISLINMKADYKTTG